MKHRSALHFIAILLTTLLLVNCSSDSIDPLDRVSNAARDNNASGISAANLNSITGVSGAIEANNADYQAAISAASNTDVDSAEEVQSLINSVNAQNEIEAAATSNDGSGVTVAEINSISGVSGAIDGNVSDYQTAIAGLTSADVDTATEIQTLVNSVNAVNLVEAAAVANDASNISIANLDTITGLTGTVAGNLSAYQTAISAAAATAVDTTAEIQALVDSVNASQSNLNLVTTAATNNSGNSLSLTVINGITGVSGAVASRLAQYQLTIASLDATAVDSTAEIQAVIDSVNNRSRTLPIESLPVRSLAVDTLPSIVLETEGIDSNATVNGNTQTIVVELIREQEVILPGGSIDVTANADAEATSTIVVNTVSGLVTASVTFSGLDAGQTVTALHIHQGFAGANGPVIAGFTVDNANGSAQLSTTLNAAQLATFLQGGTYLNLHTAANPAGQLRGQIAPANIQVLFTRIEGQQENPPVATSSTGLGYLTVNTATAAIVANVIVNGFTPTMTHIHNGFAGENGPVIVGLTQSSPGVFTVSSTAMNVAGLLGGRYYFNVHSAANPSGEIRGQLAGQTTIVARTTLQGSQENPPVSTQSSGIGYLTASISGSVTARVSTNGFTPTAAHIHTGSAGQNGAVIIALEAGTTAGSFVSPANSTAQSINGLLAGNYYFNVHSAANPGGEVRGQVVGPEVRVLRSQLEGAQQNPPVSTTSSGIGYLTLNDETGSVVANVNTSGFTPTVAHIHQGPAGQNGGIIIALEAGSSTGTFTTPANSTAQSVMGLLNGNYYFNVHSEANASGEVRGQLAGDNIEIIRTELQGQQENPPVSTASTGVGYLTVNRESAVVTARVAVSGFTPTAAHIHEGFAGQNGGIIIALGLGSSTNTFVSPENSTARNVVGLLNGNYYFNVHSAENAPGEVRGQLAGRDVEVVRTLLEPTQENPAITSSSSGIGYASINRLSGMVNANANISGFTANAAHIHDGFAGRNGSISLALTDSSVARSLPVGTSFSGSGSLSSGTDVLNGRFYFNVHNSNPGEVRGQIAGSQTTIIRAGLDSTQEIPAPNNQNPNATGVGYLTVATMSGLIWANVDVSGFTPTAAHIHQGAAGSTGGIIVPLSAATSPDANTISSFTSAAGAMAQSVNGILNGNYYFNVHSAENTPGEIRGQILTSSE